MKKRIFLLFLLLLDVPVLAINLDSSIKKWNQSLYAGSYLILKPTCTMGSPAVFRVYEIKLSGRPLN